MSAWSKAKAYVKKNPEDAMFYGITAAVTVGTIALYAYLVKLTADEQKAAYEAQEEEREWYRDQSAQGKIIMYDAMGNAIAFNPLQPLFREEA